MALAGGLLTLALLAKPAQAQQSTGAISEQFPVEYPVAASACTGEAIAIEGTLHTVNHFTDLGDGAYHVNSHFNFVGVKGTGLTTGTKYVIPAAGSSVENVVPSGQTIGGSTDISMVIGQGKIPNQNSFARLHYIINDDGTLKVESVHFHFECH